MKKFDPTICTRAERSAHNQKIMEGFYGRDLSIDDYYHVSNTKGTQYVEDEPFVSPLFSHFMGSSDVYTLVASNGELPQFRPIYTPYYRYGGSDTLLWGLLLTAQEVLDHYGIDVTKRGTLCNHGKMIKGLTREEALNLIKEFMRFETGEVYRLITDYKYLSNNQENLICRVHKPTVNEKEKDKIDFYRSGQDLARGRRTTIRAGRFFSMLFPDSQKQEIETMVRHWNESQCDPEYELRVGSSEESFVEAYTLPRAKDRDPYMKEYSKTLSESCMHYLAEDFEAGIHPCSIYASGDFEIAYAVDTLGHIGGRVVICTKTGKAGPVYVQDSFAQDLLYKYLEDSGYQYSCNDYCWDGAEFVVKKYDGNRIVAPYLDCGAYGYIDEDGNGYFYGTEEEAQKSGKKWKKRACMSNTCGTSSLRGACACCGSSFSNEYHVETDRGYSTSAYTCYSCGLRVQIDGDLVRRDETIYINGRYHREEDTAICAESGLRFVKATADYVELPDGEFLLDSYVHQYIDRSFPNVPDVLKEVYTDYIKVLEKTEEEERNELHG